MASRAAAGVAAELNATWRSHRRRLGSRSDAIRDDVNIRFQRAGLQGQMAVTAWASMRAQIPDASRFWVVAS